MPKRDQALLDRYVAESADDLREAFASQEGGWRPWADRPLVARLREDPGRAIAVLVVSLDSDDGRLFGLADELLRRRLPFDGSDATLLVSLLEAREADTWHSKARARAAVTALEARARAGDDIADLVQRVLVQVGKPHAAEGAEWTKLAARLRKLTPSVGAGLDLTLLRADDPWSVQIRPILAERFRNHGALLQHLASATQSKPSGRWLKAVEPLLANGGEELVRFLVAAALDARPRERNRYVYEGREYVSYLWLTDMSATLLRGALWAASLVDGAWPASMCEGLIGRARELENVKVGNACFHCLGERADDESVAVLARVVAQVKDRRFLKPAERALARAAEKRGVSADQLREQLVPTFGLDAAGRMTVAIGDGGALIQLVPPANARARYRSGGRESASAPETMQDAFPDEIATVKRTVAELRKELSAQRTRVENLLAAGRVWKVDDWRRHYLEHPVVQLFARRLIWRFDSIAAIPLQSDSYLAPSGTVEPPTAGEVRLWHPLDSTADEIAAWRTLLREREVAQPFKQAYREIYLLAPAERETGLYSNRFAAHIVRYPQVYALAKQRGWGVRALGPFDNDGGEQWRDFPEHRIRASFWMELADLEHAGGPIAELAATDQVRFSRPGERLPLPLDDVPPMVFSEAMRDVDLFVGVASIAGDPTWMDHGVNRFNGYWTEHAFGELPESARVRREVLAELLPALKIADRLELEDRFLRVRGNLHSYKIHLGSANILIEPHDLFLCIVPARRPSLGKVFLPFEDDRLSVILSKAILLAADDKITDQTITRQLR